MRRVRYYYLIKGRQQIAHYKERLIAIGISIAALVAIPMLPLWSHAESDITPPVLSALSLASSTFDSDSPGGGITVNAVISDNLSGFHHADILYTSPTGKQTAPGYTFAPSSPGNTSIEGVLFMNQYAESGVWKPTITVVDQSGNTHVYTSSELTSLGINADLTVSGTQDITPVQLNSLAVSGTSFDTANNDASIVFTMGLTDNLSGIGSGFVLRTISPSGNQSATNLTFSLNSETGLYDATVVIPRYSETGTWRTQITLGDNTGNSVVYDTTDLQGLGMPATFTVTGNGDTTPPTVSTLGFDVADPVINEVPFGGGVITLHGSFSDNLSGLYSPVITFTSPTGAQSTSATFSLIGGTGNQWTTNVYLPVYAASGAWTASLTLSDLAGNTQTLSNSDLQNIGLNTSFAIAKNITQTVSAGGTVSSDVENDGATVTDPVEASVTSPASGSISIVMIDSQHITSANGYVFFGRQISISAPVNTVSDPLTLAFRIDASKVPSGQNANTLQVTKNGVALPACADATTANPDACVFSRTTLGDGDIEVKIHSTTASVWASGFPASSNFTFNGFGSPIKNAPQLNNTKAGSAVPVKFDIGGNKGPNVLASGFPKSQQINCTTKATIAGSTSTTSTNGQGVNYQGGEYRYNWKTEKQWENSCRQLILTFTDGQTQVAYFKF